MSCNPAFARIFGGNLATVGPKLSQYKIDVLEDVNLAKLTKSALKVLDMFCLLREDYKNNIRKTLKFRVTISKYITARTVKVQIVLFVVVFWSRFFFEALKHLQIKCFGGPKIGLD